LSYVDLATHHQATQAIIDQAVDSRSCKPSAQRLKDCTKDPYNS